MLRNIRRVVQILSLLFFLFLIFKTVFPANFAVPVDLILKIDPLAAIATTLASRAISSESFIYAVVLIVLTLLLGRFFCGWFCPLGTTLDVLNHILFRRFKRPKVQTTPLLRNMKYYILVLFLVGAIFSLQIIWILDPLSIVTRSYALTLYSYFNYVVIATFNALYEIKGVNKISEPVYSFLRSHILPIQQPVFRMHLFFFIVFALIISLSILQRRFWCRNLCPLGALLGLLSKFSFYRRTVSTECIECGKCIKTCGLSAIPESPYQYWAQECTECMSCVAVCPVDAIEFRFKMFDRSMTPAGGLNVSKRAFITSVIVGISAVPLIKLDYAKRKLNESVIRPPGALAEEDFLEKCIRCGMCMKVCPTGGLQPALLEAGLGGIGTPMLVPRVGYCEYNCVSCTRVCPTDAIMELTEDVKKTVKIGTARIDTTRCIPWSEYEDCLVCEEQCPIPTKAIKFEVRDIVTFTGDVRRIKFPVVLKDKCIGCGMCENKCPVKPSAAIFVTSQVPGRSSHGGINYAVERSKMESPSPQSIGKVKPLGAEEGTEQ